MANPIPAVDPLTNALFPASPRFITISWRRTSAAPSFKQRFGPWSPGRVAGSGRSKRWVRGSPAWYASSLRRRSAMHAVAIGLLLAAAPSTSDRSAVSGLDAIYPQLDALYLDLHQTPELSGRETKTAAKLAERLRQLGYEVTTGVGGTGVVGVLRNGKGPTVLLRTELDALPVEEKTGLPFASKVTAKDPT